MSRPTREQLKKINALSRTELTEDQVFTFRSLSADTLPVKRYSWMGEYAIHMNRNMLNDLKQGYQTGVGLLASHNSNRLPFGRSFDAVVETDVVNGENVDTLYVDQYIVEYVEKDGNRVPLRTEVNGMTTEDIANHISVGHTFDTSIGFAMTDIKCSICKNDIRDYKMCKHNPGGMYEVQVGEEIQEMRCDVLAEGGEALENSLVYAGAVDRAIIQNNSSNFSTAESGVQPNVKEDETTLYNVDDIKKVPLGSQIYCRFTKGAGMEMFTFNNERQDMEVNEMTVENKSTELQTDLAPATPIQSMFSKEDYDAMVAEKTELAKEVGSLTDELTTVNEELALAKSQIEVLSAKAILAEEYRKDLVAEALSVATKARGNAFNADRFGKYLETLSDAEIKEELNALKGEFSDSMNESRATDAELEEDTADAVELSVEEMRTEASLRAMEIYRKNGGDLIELTKAELAKIKEGK